MTTLKQLKSAKPGDYIEIYWPEMKNGYYKVYKNSKNTLLLSELFFKGSRPIGQVSFSIKRFYDSSDKFKIIPGNSKKAQTLEGKFTA